MLEDTSVISAKMETQIPNDITSIFPVNNRLINELQKIVYINIILYPVHIHCILITY